jgi:hypothetical protein
MQSGRVEWADLTILLLERIGLPITAIIVTRTFLHTLLDNVKSVEHPRWFGL